MTPEAAVKDLRERLAEIAALVVEGEVALGAEEPEWREVERLFSAIKRAALDGCAARELIS